MRRSPIKLSPVNPWTSRLIAFGIAGSAAALVVFAAPAWLAGTTRAIAAYDTGAAFLLATLWTVGMHGKSKDTQTRASFEDPGRNAVFGVVLIGVVVALVAAVSILGHGPRVMNADEKAIAYGVGIAAIVVGWALIHTMFTFRYAHLFFYRDPDDNETDRGLDFPNTADPNDFDFAYFSFGIGMTYQVSDVRVTDRGIRRLVLFHGVVSFVYNTAIVALVVNILSGLLH